MPRSLRSSPSAATHELNALTVGELVKRAVRPRSLRVDETGGGEHRTGEREGEHRTEEREGQREHRGERGSARAQRRERVSTAAVQRRERGTEGRGTRDARYDAHLSCPSRYAHHWLKALTSPTCIMRRATTFRRERASSRLSQQFQARNSLSLRNLAPNRASRAWSFLAVRGGEAGRGGAWRA